MPELKPLFDQHRADIERDLEAQPDAKAAYDTCIRWLSDIRRTYIAQTDDSDQRIRINELMSAAQSGLAAMVAVSQVDISMKLGANLPTIPQRRHLNWHSMLVYLPSALCTILGAWLFFEQEWSAMPLALASALCSFLTLTRLKTPSRTVPDVVGETRIDPIELMRRLERLIQDMDLLLVNRSSSISEGSPLELNTSLMESIQMLMEARLSDDGEFALRALPQMLNALNRQGVDILMYDAEHKANFDLLPASEGGETIRPALLKDGQLLCRGQATIKG